MSPGAGSSEGKPASVADAGGGGASTSGTGEAPANSSGAPALNPGAPVAAAPCQPALADTPTALFGTRVVIRLPKGLELVERNPFYAQAAAPNLPGSCGQAIRYAAVGFVEFPGSSSATTIRDQLMEFRGLPAAGLSWSEEGSRGRTYTGAYTAPADEKTGAPALSGWFVLRETKEKYVYFALFETDPGSWEALRPVFIASGQNFLVKPRAPQAAGAALAADPVKSPGATGGAGGGGITAQPTGSPATKAK